ncbi:MAG: spermidine/putrescine ABC transporter substrate-binding protein [Spirulinaceae cyanobacterium RM2_2_10]|nr:spermidine/putrescine ABC transporter substrate-binding protein [Spirulinaceae cyanobacterium SM2_1_0]NJO19528.1 spermidine/putrescine ABC transporter substrate-binding protein [Spirulinaceae cyanobacterium RM2_2_10]
MRRLLVFVLLFAIGVALPLGCSAPNSTGGDGDGSQQVLSIYNWSTYIDEETIPEFEEKFNVEVQYDTFESNEALLAKIQPGNPGYDIVVPTSDYVESMVAEGLLAELNHDNIPNLKYLDEAFADPVFDPKNRYSVPYQWGTIGIGYNVEKTGEDITTWEQVFDPKYAGRVALMEDARAMMGAILMYLGYDPNTTNPEEVAAAKDFLIEKQDVIATFAPDTGQDLLDQGEVDIAVEWNGDIFQLMEENEDIRYAIPEEGTIVWTDNLAILSDAPNKELAEKFINFTLEPEVSARISNYVKFGTPNREAIARGLIESEDLENPGIYPPPETFEKLEYAVDLGEDTALYDEAWTELKVAIGK